MERGGPVALRRVDVRPGRQQRPHRRPVAALRCVGEVGLLPAHLLAEGFLARGSDAGARHGNPGRQQHGWEPLRK